MGSGLETFQSCMTPAAHTMAGKGERREAAKQEAGKGGRWGLGKGSAVKDPRNPIHLAFPRQNPPSPFPLLATPLCPPPSRNSFPPPSSFSSPTAPTVDYPSPSPSPPTGRRTGGEGAPLRSLTVMKVPGIVFMKHIDRKPVGCLR